MPNPLIAVVGDISNGRILDPPLLNQKNAREAAEAIGSELAKQKFRLLVYGGPYLEADVVRGFVKGKPKEDKSIIMWYSSEMVPDEFEEENSNPKLFERRIDRGTSWEVAFYRSIVKADGLILMGGGNATKITGLVALGNKMPILTLSQFGGGAAQVWDSLSAGEDLPTRDEITLMASKWHSNIAKEWVDNLANQIKRKQNIADLPQPVFPIISGILFLIALASIPWNFNNDKLGVWFLFLVPALAGAAGSLIRPLVDKQTKVKVSSPTVWAILIIGLIAGGISGVLFVTAQFTANTVKDQNYAEYAHRSLPFALAIGFIAGLTSEAVFGKLLGTDVVKVKALTT